MDEHEQMGMPLGDEPRLARARAGDPDTSHVAAVAAGDLSERQRDVLALLREYPKGLTDEQLVRVYQRRQAALGLHEQTPQSIRSRRSELRDRGLVQRIEGLKRRMESTGSLAQVWRAQARPAASYAACVELGCPGPTYCRDGDAGACGLDVPGLNCALR